jgi:hypothetical protein
MKHSARASKVRAGGLRTPARSRDADMVFVVLLAVGLVLRILLARTTWLQPDSDEATGMIMALRASQGHLSLVFWGGNYGGALVTWLEAPLVALFGLHLWIFWIVDTAIAALCAWLLRLVAGHIVSPVAAAVAGGTFFFFPAAWLFWSGREYVFWEPAIAFALGACLMALRWFESRRPADAYLFGLLTGLAIWTYPLVVSLVAPAVVIVVWALRRQWGLLAGVAAAALVGVLPWLAYFAVHGRSAFTRQAVSDSTSVALRHSLTQVLPAALAGGQKRLGVIWAEPLPSHRVLVAIAVGVYGAAVVGMVLFALRRQVALCACATSLVLWPFVLVAGHVPVGLATFRYGLVAVAPILLLASYALSMLRMSLVVAGLALATVLPIAVSDTSAFASAPGCNPSLVQAGRSLQREHVTAVWASYWIASAMTVCDYPYLTAASVVPVRDTAAEGQAAREARSTYLVFAGNVLDQQIATWVRENKVVARRTIVGGYAVWYFSIPVTPAMMGLDSAF